MARRKKGKFRKAKLVAAPPAPGPDAENGQARVGRLRFDDRGGLFEESSFATEAELQGFKARQLPLAMGSGERPIEELPMFSSGMDTQPCEKCGQWLASHNEDGSCVEAVA